MNLSAAVPLESLIVPGRMHRGLRPIVAEAIPTSRPAAKQLLIVRQKQTLAMERESLMTLKRRERHLLAVGN
jgi:hypothetical protein